MALKLFYNVSDEELEIEELVKKAVKFQTKSELYQRNIAAMLR